MTSDFLHRYSTATVQWNVLFGAALQTFQAFSWQGEVGLAERLHATAHSALDATNRSSFCTALRADLLTAQPREPVISGAYSESGSVVESSNFCAIIVR